jgi:hypothetical protein
MLINMEDRKNFKINKLINKYKSKDNLIIARTTRKTIRYIEKNTHNFPNEYIILKNRIIDSCYKILENIYRANIFQEINDKKEIIVNIQMLNFYLEESYNYGILSNKKLLSYSSYLLEIDKMVRS